MWVRSGHDWGGAQADASASVSRRCKTWQHKRYDGQSGSEAHLWADWQDVSSPEVVTLRLRRGGHFQTEHTKCAGILYE
jgi:hypothetical protein